MAETHLKAPAPRPLSPHLTVFRPLVTMVMSIAHRITGAAIYVGMLVLTWWLVAIVTGPFAYIRVSDFFGSWFGRLVLYGFTWALILHLLGGIRHLIWDTGAGFHPATARAFAWATFIGSVLLTVAVWVAAYATR